jgi:hypothetical protein
MAHRMTSLLLVFFLLLALANAKDKNKVLLPGEVLQARTVLVVVNPDDGISLEHPNDNPIARQDVEKAMMLWGRFSLAMEASTADLIITVHKGSGKIVTPVVRGGPMDNRPVIAESTGDANGQTTRIGVQQGRPPALSDPNVDPQSTGPHVGEEVGVAQDMFVVYRGGQTDPLDKAPVWRYSGKDALRSPDVPAVDQFRKVIEEAEKQAQKRTKQSP